jgi:hypothetical protein
MDYSNFKIDFIGPIEEGSSYHDAKHWEKCVRILIENKGYKGLSVNNMETCCKSLIKLIESYRIIELPCFENGFSLECESSYNWTPEILIDAQRILDQIFDQISKNQI